MPSVFENVSDSFYTAFFEPDPDRRKAAIEAWIQAATPIIQSAVENDIRTYLESILADTWTREGWKRQAEKFNRLYQTKPFIDTYKLCLDVKLRQHDSADFVVDALSPNVRGKTLEAAKRALPEARPIQSSKREATSSVRTTDDDDAVDEYGDDRSSNDDRSDSMNPNNDSYQASADNRSDQMNPNNDAYWSSRGR